MDIDEAYKVLQKYFQRDELENLYRKKKFDHSGYDTNKKFEYNAKLLQKKALDIKDSKEYEEVMKAAGFFEEKYRYSEYE